MRWVKPRPNYHADDLILLVQAWPRVEQAMMNRAAGGKDSFGIGESEFLVNAVRRALRIEVQVGEEGLKYALLFLLLHSHRYRSQLLLLCQERPCPHKPLPL